KKYDKKQEYIIMIFENYRSLIKYISMVLFILLVFSINFVCYAQTDIKTRLDTLVKNSSISNTALVSVSIREAETGKLVYQRYGDYFLHTASALKVFTTPLSLVYLGKDYSLSTVVYKDKSNSNIYVKLSADPLLSYNDLKNLCIKIKENGVSSINGSLIINDDIIDDIPWGVGWMWDDENNYLMPKYSAYNLDHNVIKVNVSPGKYNSPPDVSIDPYYPVKIVNNAISSNLNSIIIERKPWLDPENIYISGKISKSISKNIPAGIPKNYFIYRFKEALKQSNINFNGNIISGKIPHDAEKIAAVNHSLLDIVSYTNQKSDNLAAETLLKLVGNKFSKTTGTTKNGLIALKSYYASIGASADKQEIVDGSGASHNDLVQANWMTLALSKLYKTSYFSTFQQTLAQPYKQGTIQYRFKNLQNRLWAKTGTLAGISSITGYLKANSGKYYTFAILIQNYKGSSAPAKNLENSIINEISKL
ncbi:MAG: D-alanyl-D-alanine carboxypeptidase/D-alanyl-D-alanine-endopeptidase, partial [Cyanobacteriota bacterium]